MASSRVDRNLSTFPKYDKQNDFVISLNPIVFKLKNTLPYNSIAPNLSYSPCHLPKPGPGVPHKDHAQAAETADSHRRSK